PVRPQIRAAEVPAGMSRGHVSPEFNCRPPPLGMAAGHTV
ncbi:hypothetical protein A2U01_0076857, partial [Trifolium medium]|nr:hypothetical protein [Trifolium medium]